MNTNDRVNEILIISASERRFELQNAVHESLNAPVSVAATFREATTAIARHRFKGVVLDEGLMDLNPAGAEQFLARCNHELPIFVKLAITGLPRCIQQVQLGIRRFDEEQRIATVSAQRSINSQLRDVLTSIVIHSQLALNTFGVPQNAIEHIESVLESADALKKAIGSNAE